MFIIDIDPIISDTERIDRLIGQGIGLVIGQDNSQLIRQVIGLPIGQDNDPPIENEYQQMLSEQKDQMEDQRNDREPKPCPTNGGENR